MTEPAEQKWQIDKRISVADVVAVVSSAIMVILAYSTLDKRITVLERTETSRGEDTREIKQNVEYIRRAVEDLRSHQQKREVGQ